MCYDPGVLEAIYFGARIVFAVVMVALVTAVIMLAVAVTAMVLVLIALQWIAVQIFGETDKHGRVRWWAAL